MSTNSVNFSSWFDDIIIDNNGVPVSDINAGVRRLIPILEENIWVRNFDDIYIITQSEEGYPDLVADRTMGSPQLWWWHLVCNRGDDPLHDVQPGYGMYVIDNGSINNVIDTAQTSDVANNTKIGTIVELN